MRRIVRSILAALFAIHGLIHVIGVAEGFGWAEVSQLTEPISAAMGAAWLAAAVAVVAAATLLARRVRWWWAVGGVAAIASQAVIVTSWSDAKAGSLANVLLVLAAAHGLAAEGPRSLRARYRRRADVALAGWHGPSAPLVTERDLAHLPPPVAAYLVACGAVGRPHVRGFRARIHGRIRGDTDKAWMPFVGEQVNTFGPSPTRLFAMDATMLGLPVDVLHEYVGPAATMEVRLMSAITMVDARGPAMDQSETVTLLNDLCVLAPAAIVDAPITWTAVDDHHAEAVFSNGQHTIAAMLTFNDDHELVDFVSDDRLRSSPDGTTFTPQRWSTPIAGYRSFGGRRLGAHGTGRWRAGDEGADVDYLELVVDDIAYDESAAPVAVRAAVLTASQV
jgi:hypothetical protein